MVDGFRSDDLRTETFGRSTRTEEVGIPFPDLEGTNVVVSGNLIKVVLKDGVVESEDGFRLFDWSTTRSFSDSPCNSWLSI